MATQSSTEARVYRLTYGNAKNDPNPSFLALGTYENPNTNKTVIGGLNLNYLSQNQLEVVRNGIGKILKGKNLKERYDLATSEEDDLKEIFQKLYRTYDKEYVNVRDKISLSEYEKTEPDEDDIEIGDEIDDEDDDDEFDLEEPIDDDDIIDDEEDEDEDYDPYQVDDDDEDDVEITDVERDLDKVAEVIAGMETNIGRAKATKELSAKMEKIVKIIGKREREIKAQTEKAEEAAGITPSDESDNIIAPDIDQEDDGEIITIDGQEVKVSKEVAKMMSKRKIKDKSEDDTDDFDYDDDDDYDDYDDEETDSEETDEDDKDEYDDDDLEW